MNRFTDTQIERATEVVKYTFLSLIVLGLVVVVINFTELSTLLN